MVPKDRNLSKSSVTVLREERPGLGRAVSALVSGMVEQEHLIGVVLKRRGANQSLYSRRCRTIA